MMFCAVCGVIGVLFGFIFAVLLQKRKKIGALRMDRSDPNEAPYLFLELDPDGMEKINRFKTVVLRVRLENYIPRN